MKIGVCGGTGLIGRALVKELIQKGHEVTIFTRKKDILLEFTSFIKSLFEKAKSREQTHLENLNKLGTLEIIPNSPPTPEDISELDGIINLVGEPILGSRWTQEHKQKLKNSRIDYTKKLVQNIQNSSSRPKFFFSASAIGYYGMWEENPVELNEDSPHGNDFLAKLCLEWEQEALKGSEFCRVIVGRIGIVLSTKGGALAQMLPVFRAFLGGHIGSGKQYMSWIHIKDVTNAILFLIENSNLSGVFNLTSPNAITNKEFSETLAKILRRPCFFFVPSLTLEIIYGAGAEIVTKGQKVFPARLVNSQFEFQFSDLENAIQDLIQNNL